MKNKQDKGLLYLSIIFAVCGALLGYGFYGDFQHACIGAAFGILSPFVLLLVGS